VVTTGGAPVVPFVVAVGIVDDGARAADAVGVLLDVLDGEDVFRQGEVFERPGDHHDPLPGGEGIPQRVAVLGAPHGDDQLVHLGGDRPHHGVVPVVEGLKAPQEHPPLRAMAHRPRLPPLRGSYGLPELRLHAADDLLRRGRPPVLADLKEHVPVQGDGEDPVVAGTELHGLQVPGEALQHGLGHLERPPQEEALLAVLDPQFRLHGHLARSCRDASLADTLPRLQLIPWGEGQAVGEWTRRELAKRIEQTRLGPAVTRADVEKLCEEARNYGFYGVCVNPCHVARAKALLQDSEVRIITVVGFPHGANAAEVKAAEAEQAIRDGADELDMVLRIGALKERDFAVLLEELEAVRNEIRKSPRPITLKAILETALLTDDEKVAACILTRAAGADFVKTSTGFGPGGATLEDVRLLKRTVGDGMGVKAAGGIRDYETAVAMLEAGADRIGTSSGVQILEGAPD